MIQFLRQLRHAFLPALLLAASGAQAVGPTGLPDSGQNLCVDGANFLVACSSGNTGDGATYPRQDGRFGRDPAAAAGTLAKTGAGAVGFDYTKVANDGSDLAAGAALGTAATDWACTRDNTTGLTWEVKTASNTDRRYSGHTYTWYSTTGATNGGDVGSAGANTCNATLPGNLCNTQAYADAVNAMNSSGGLCGAQGWRLPTVRELTTLVHFGVMNPSIDTTYFPNTPASHFWSASTYLGPQYAWYVFFSDGGAVADLKTVTYSVRLVRGGPF
jgi:hypothetical protein